MSSAVELSIIIPNYNKAMYIGKCIDSIVGQSFKNFELIIVDDCSKDASRDIINDYAKQYPFIVPIFLSKNKGVSNARNMGIRAASGKYVTFIDSDDVYINQDKLLNEMKCIYSDPSQNIIAYSLIKLIDENDCALNVPYNGKVKKNELAEGESFLSFVSMLKQKRVPRDYVVRKDYILQVGAYSFPINFYEDLDLVIRLAQTGAYFKCTYDYGTGYRQLNGGLSSKSTQDHKKARKNICKRYYIDLHFFQKRLCDVMFITGAIGRFFDDVKYVLKRTLKH